METVLTIQGRQVAAHDLGAILDLIATHPDWHRTRLSQELCRYWNWVNEKGQLKDMAARALLRKLDGMGLIALPAPVRSANNGLRNRPVVLDSLDLEVAPIKGSLSDLQPIRIHPAESTEETRLFRGLLQRHHYLGFSGPVGENLQYLIHDRHGRLLGCMLYGAAAWRVANRDRFIGWDEAARQRGLSRIANNMRFLILPWIRVPHLASHLLALTRRCISTDWQEKYGHPIVLLETFVEQRRFAGTCYQADNWIQVGRTRGRSRNHNSGDPGVPVKSVWLYPLCRGFRRLLTAPAKRLK
ncbi:MAG: DUF4338 domain-containing protein [Gammaproteobacteria bacterium]|nr:DUF4338 domain-containing protein [Gammaproteobacteria bacterium]